MVSAGSHVGAEIHAKSAHLAGRVTGDVEAEDLVVLTSSAVLEGSLRAGRVVVVEGAAITGTISVRPRRN